MFITPLEINYNKIVPPHLNAEVYRTDTTGTNTLPYLEYIRVHSDGMVLIGSSELTGRYWDGGANIYKEDVKNENPIHLEKKTIRLATGTADGCFVQNSNTVLLCEDSGAISIWTTQDEVWKQWNEELSVAEHDDAILAVDCLEPGRQYVTAGSDRNVKVWDICDLICIQNYSTAHTMAVSTIAVRMNSQSNFATGSLDQYISLWDENTIRPVCDVFKNDCGIRCLRWLDEYVLIFGDDAGSLSFADIRVPGKVLKLTQFPAAVHEIAVQPKMGRLAVCCDNNTLSICQITRDVKVEIINKEKNTHNGFIRSVAWDLIDTDTLYSVGWDGKVIKRLVN